MVVDVPEEEPDHAPVATSEVENLMGVANVADVAPV